MGQGLHTSGTLSVQHSSLTVSLLSIMSNYVSWRTDLLKTRLCVYIH